MMDALTPANLVAYSAQIASITLVASALPTLLRLRSPIIRHAYWRCVLAMCLLLPGFQTPQRVGGGQAAATTASVFSSEGAPVDSASAVAAGVGWPNLVIAALVAGSIARLGWLFMGWLRLRRLCDRGELAMDVGYLDLQHAAKARAEICYLADLDQPVTFGLVRPVILLPNTLRAEPLEIRHAVLAHEIGHVRRRDWVWVVVEEIVRAIFWFHPAIWWLIARVRAAREEVVDQLAVMMTGQRQAYLRALLTFADGTPLSPAAGFGQRRHLFHRMVQLSREDVMSSKRLIATSVVLAVVVAAGGWYAIRAFPLTQTADSPSLQKEAGPLERVAKLADPDNPAPLKLRDVMPVHPTDPVARQMSVRVTIRQTVDVSGAVAEARVVGLDLATEHLRVAIQGGDMAKKMETFFARASFRVGPGQPSISAGTLQPVVEAFVESAVAAVSQWLYEPPATGPIAFDTTIHFAGTKPATLGATSTEDSPLADGALRVGGNIKPPTKTRDVRPVYPPEASEARVQGVVILEVRIEGDGRVAQARVLRSIPMLDTAALDAVRQWEFTPTLLNGVAMPVVMVVTIQFTLS